MGRLAITIALWLALAGVSVGAVNPSTPVRRPAQRGDGGRWGWFADPRSAVLLTLGSVLLIGGGRKWFKTIQGQRAAARLNEPNVTVDEIAEAATYGREGLIDLFRLLGTATDAPRRDAACRAIAVLWKGDNLIAEEEKALVRRGYVVDWKARRRYPRALSVPIPIRVEFGVPALRDTPGEVGPGNLAWSYRIMGAERASLEEFTPWIKGQGRASFEINPTDFATNGPHKLVLQAKVRTEGLTGPWEVELPHVPFNFELDPRLEIEALLTLPDESRGAAIERNVTLGSVAAQDDGSRFVTLTENLVLRDPPHLRIATPLPCELAHNVHVEFEGVPGLYPAGVAIVSGQGMNSESLIVSFPLVLRNQLPPGSIEHAGEIRIRAILTADPQRGWADPDIRSIWTGTIETSWDVARVVRR